MSISYSNRSLAGVRPVGRLLDTAPEGLVAHLALGAREAETRQSTVMQSWVAEGDVGRTVPRERRGDAGLLRLERLALRDTSGVLKLPRPTLSREVDGVVDEVANGGPERTP